MPFNGNGVYSAPSSPGAFNPAIANQLADPTSWNTLLADFVQAFDLQICRDGQSTISADIPFNGKKITGLGNATATTDAVNAGQILGNGLTAADDTGAADAYVIAPAIAITAYAAYQWFQFKALNANTGASTLNVSLLGVKSIKRPNGDALAANDILAGALCDVMYDGTNFILMDGGSNAINYSLLTTRGDIIARGASIPQRVALGTNGQGLISNGTDPLWGVPAIRSYLSGLGLSTAGGSGTFGVAVGIACDSTGVAMMALASAYTKTTGAWAVGTGNGSLDTGTIANSTVYHVFEIIRPDTGVVDILTSLSATSPTLPTDYTLFRRIGSILTDTSAHWIKFSQKGDEFLWDVSPPLDVNATNPGTSAVTRTLSVPTGVQVNALFNVGLIAGVASPVTLLMSPLDVSDQNPAGTSPLGNMTVVTASPAPIFTTLNVRTNTSAQVRSRINFSDGNTILTISTFGWIDRRGRDA